MGFGSILATWLLSLEWMSGKSSKTSSPEENKKVCYPTSVVDKVLRVGELPFGWWGQHLTITGLYRFFVVSYNETRR